MSFDFNFEKAMAALVYLASRTDDVSEFDKYKAAKLLFLADKYHLVRYGRPILGDSYRALEHGPIPQHVLDLLRELTEGKDCAVSVEARRLQDVLEIDRHYRYPRMRARGSVDLGALSKSEIMALDHVIAAYGRRSFSELRVLTHGMTAYTKPWGDKPASAKSAAMHYEDFFEDEPDAVAGALEEMLEDAALREAFPEYEPA